MDVSRHITQVSLPVIDVGRRRGPELVLPNVNAYDEQAGAGGRARLVVAAEACKVALSSTDVEDRITDHGWFGGGAIVPDRL